MIKCSKCGENKSTDEFSVTGKKNYKRHSCKTCWAKYHKKYGIDNKEKISEYQRSKRLQRDYGLSVDKFNKMVKNQNNCCAICSEIFKEIPCIDHNHSTGKVRKLLCNSCNKGLGHFRDNPSNLVKALDYLCEFSEEYAVA